MSLVNMKRLLQKARANQYGIGAFNMTDYNSARAIVDGAAALNAPVIIQLSVKTIRLWGAESIGSWVRYLAQNSFAPIALHLDHCTDVDIIRCCIDAGWTSVMFDGSALPFEENLKQSKQVYALTQTAGVGLEVELGAIGGVEDEKIVLGDHAVLADYEECIDFCNAMPNLAAFAPAIGTAHGFYKGSPRIAYELLREITQAVTIPIALHGGTGLSNSQFHQCIAYGCAKINISSQHKKDYIDGFFSAAQMETKPTEPISYITRQYEQMRKGVEQMITIFGSVNKAE